MKKEVLGVDIDDVSMEEALSTVKTWLTTTKANKQYVIVTPNPEFLVVAQVDTEFKEILNQADMAIPDGVGLKLSGKIKNTTSGTDLMEELCKLCRDLGFCIGLIGGGDLVAKKTKECLIKKYPGLKVVYASQGLNIVSGSYTTSNITKTINKCDILFVAFGMIKQEKWIVANLDQLPIKVAMGVGGAFDYLSGVVPRAPRFLRRLGLEWLFRLIIQPWRIKRQLNLVKYIFLVLKSRYGIT